MRIIINEKQQDILMKCLLKESEGEQNLEVIRYIDSLFRKDKYINSDEVIPKSEQIAVWLTTNKPASKEMVFNVVQDKFKNLTDDKKARDNRLHDIVDAWFGVTKKYNKKTGTILPK